MKKKYKMRDVVFPLNADVVCILGTFALMTHTKYEVLLHRIFMMGYSKFKKNQGAKLIPWLEESYGIVQSCLPCGEKPPVE